MSVNETEFVDIRQDIVQDELNIKVEDCSGDEENPGHEFSASEIKCGDIFHSANGLFVFCCYYCSERFAAIEEFVSHFEEKHANTVTTTETNETSLNLREVEANEYLGSEASEAVPWITDNSISQENLNSGNYVLSNLFNKDGTNVDKGSKVYSEMEIQCPKCPYTCRWKNDLAYHLCHNHNDNSRNLLKREIRNAGANIESEIEIFQVQGNVENSNSFVNKEKELGPKMKRAKSQTLKCKFCGEVLSTVELWVAHEKTHPPGRPYQCRICLNTFKTKQCLDQHKAIHTARKSFKCTECPLAFRKRSILIVHHKRVHLKEKKFSCDHCEKRFASNADRKSHMRTHFNEKPYQCEECGKSFTTSGGLSFHKLQHTQTKRHTCEICQKSFYTTVILRDHMPVHTKEKLFQCTVCPSRFTTQKHLSRHMKLHSGEKNYVCTICKKAFAQRSGLNLHMKSHGVVGNR